MSADPEAFARRKLHYSRLLRRASKRRFGKESARRRAKFRAARMILRAAARMRGRIDTTGITNYNRSGQPSELAVLLSPDEEMAWTPRGGFVVRALDAIPF